MSPRPKRKPKAAAAATPTETARYEVKRPDPLFKQLMTKVLSKVGLDRGPTELQIAQTTSSDMLITIPAGVSTENTLFDFFRATNVVEFKSASDKLSKEAFAVQLARVYLLFAETPALEFSQILNVIVSSRYPREFLSYSQEEGCPFKVDDNREWLYRARIGYQEVALVVCEKLPLEPRYGSWLIFADATTQKWRDFIKMTASQHDWELLELARGLRPKEFSAMASQILELFEQYSPEERARIRNDSWDFIDTMMQKMGIEEREKLISVVGHVFPIFEPEDLDQVLSGVKPEDLGQFLSKLPPDKKAEVMKFFTENAPKPEE